MTLTDPVADPKADQSADAPQINGAESIVRTLVSNGVEVCFANPGTSEMHFVAALDRTEGMRCVLGLFEGVVTGAADGYGRMADKPAVNLLHLGPGLANGLANLHNAKRGSTPIVNIVGDHATYHSQYDAPLTSDVEGVARPFSGWLRKVKNSTAAAQDVADAISASFGPPGRSATVILPADAAWGTGGGVAKAPPRATPALPSAAEIERVASRLTSGRRIGLILGLPGLRGAGLEAAARLATKTGVRLLCAYAVARNERGAGRAVVEAIPYAVDAAVKFLADFDELILIGGDAPIAFFAYPDKPSVLSAKDCTITTLTGPDGDVAGTLGALRDAADAAGSAPVLSALLLPALPTGKPNAAAIANAVAALMPDNTIVVDESVSNGGAIGAITRTARPHDFMKNVGGAIGFGLPAAVGAAIACPDRRVLCLEGDGSAMYTVQAFWTAARENLNTTFVVFANRAYAVLRNELRNVGVTTVGPRATDMLEIGRPTLNWVKMSESMGVEARRAEDMETFNDLLAEGFKRAGPLLIEIVL
jgi:acetolactate synthase-1/2/3 large subunit